MTHVKMDIIELINMKMRLDEVKHNLHECGMRDDYVFEQIDQLDDMSNRILSKIESYVDISKNDFDEDYEYDARMMAIFDGRYNAQQILIKLDNGSLSLSNENELE